MAILVSAEKKSCFTIKEDKCGSESGMTNPPLSEGYLSFLLAKAG
jgi:hypothetical protein